MEGGYYKGNVQAMIGVARVLLQLDYQSGPANSVTAGFTYNISPQLQFNPAVYVSNDTGHKVWGYAVLTGNIDVFAPHPQSPLPATLPKSDDQKNKQPAQ